MNFEDLEVKDKAPYPEIEDATTDLRTVAVLKNLASGIRGELSAVLTYIYQSVIADKTHSQIANIFEEVAIVEMSHLDMLMHAISAFGGTPKYEDANGNAFGTRTLNYSQKLSEMLNSNIQSEEHAIKEYTEAINIVSNESLKKLFERIILDEQCHLKIFNTIKNNVEFLSI